MDCVLVMKPSGLFDNNYVPVSKIIPRSLLNHSIEIRQLGQKGSSICLVYIQ
jgi:hypothetical protein